MIVNDYTFPFGGRRYRIAREQVEAGMRRQRLRVEVRLTGELRARYQGRYLDIAECDPNAERPIHRPPAKPVRKDHNAGGRSKWMEGFFDRPSSAAVERTERLTENLERRLSRRSSRFECPKPQLGKFHQQQNASLTGKPSA